MTGDLSAASTASSIVLRSTRWSTVGVFLGLVPMLTLLLANATFGSASNEINITATSRGAEVLLKNSLPIQEFRITVVRQPDGANISGALGPVGMQAFFRLDFDETLLKFTGFDTNQTYILPQKDFGDILDIRVNKSGNYCLSDFVLLNLEAQTMAYNVVTSQCVAVNISDTSYAGRELPMKWRH